MSRITLVRVVLTLLVLTTLLSTTAVAAGPEFEAMAKAADAFANSGKPMIITADKLYENLNDGDKTNDPVIIDIRKPEDYARGHIPGAINIPFANLFKAENLAKIPKDKPVVIYCYTGHTASMASFTLNAMGYNTVSLKWAIMGWTKDNTVRTEVFGMGAAMERDYKVETAANQLTGTFTTPTVTTGKTTVADMLAARADAFLASGKPVVLTADKLYENLNDGDKTNDPVIIDTRKPEEYAAGHIPGAVNIQLKDLFKPETLAKLPPDKQIVIYCYTGHTGGMASFMLTNLGYNAVDLKYGIMGWTKDTKIAPMRFGVGADAERDYKVEKAAAPAPTLPKSGEPVPLPLAVLAATGLLAVLVGRRMVKA